MRSPVTDDIFDLLEGNQLPDQSQNSLPILSLWQLAVYYVIFFTLYVKKFPSHYDDEKRSYLCLGDECPACAAGVKATEHIYLPAWDVQNRRVGVVKFDVRVD